MNKTILLADDSVTIRKVVELTFMDESFELLSVGNGSEALASFNDQVDLVIADVHMPGEDGYEVCRLVKERSAETPVLLLVGTFESFDEGKATQVAADGFLKKPFDSQDLLDRVHQLLGRSGASEAEPATADANPKAETEPATAAPVFEPTRADEPSAAPPAEEPSASPEVGLTTPTETPGGRAGAAEEAGDQEAAALADGQLSDEMIDRIARRVVELLSEEAIRDVVWEVIPDLAEVVIKERLEQLEKQVE